MSKGLGIMERAVAACIERCKRRDVHADLYVEMGKEPPPTVVQVRAWEVCVHLNPDIGHLEGLEEAD